MRVACAACLFLVIPLMKVLLYGIVLIAVPLSMLKQPNEARTAATVHRKVRKGKQLKATSWSCLRQEFDTGRAKSRVEIGVIVQFCISLSEVCPLRFRE